jgi:pSer/pThr/pTyr-binding forkhead associated (FHA) protein
MAEVKNICLEALERHCEGGDSGRLDFRHGNFEGQIFTHDRLIVHAKLGALEGIPALFRLFDWGDAETTWMTDVKAEQETLHLTMEAASMLYAENLQERANPEVANRAQIEQVLAPEVLANSTVGLESVLKHYTILLECTVPELLPNGFTFIDATKNSYVIGSSEEADVRIADPSVEPLHCGVILEKGSVLVWDLGAQSGVKLNNHRIEQDILKVGDVMALGNVELRVRFQLRRPTIKPKPAPPVDPNAKPGTTPATAAPGTPVAPPGPISAEVPKGAITYEKVAKQLKNSGKASPFLEKLGSLFGAKKK